MDQFPLVCSLCIFAEPPMDPPNPAWTIMNGQAVCESHQGLVQGGLHSSALAMMRTEQRHPVWPGYIPGPIQGH